LPAGEDGPADGPRRRFLIRNCYINPDCFRSYRPLFIKHGFHVVDCPPITRQGKTSADMVMVMDILDALQHPTRFDEFILLSGDSDFRPVLLRLRSHDRRTVVLSVDSVAAAYESACDRLIEGDEFIELGLRRTAAAEAPPILERLAAKVEEEARRATVLSGRDLTALYRRFPECAQSRDWLGFGSAQDLTLLVVELRDGLEYYNGGLDWSVRAAPIRPPVPSHAPAQIGGGAWPKGAAGQAVPRPAAGDDLRARVLDAVRRIVAESAGPVPMAEVANKARAALGEDAVRRSSWVGFGTLSNLLRHSPDLGLAVDTRPPGAVYDPFRHAPADDGQAARCDRYFQERCPELVEFARRIHMTTDAPLLTPEQYAATFDAIAASLAWRPYSLTDTSRQTRDRLAASGSVVGRKDICFILKGLAFTRGDLALTAGVESDRLAEWFCDNVLNLCRRNQVELAPGDVERIRGWIAGAPAAPPTEPGGILSAAAPAAPDAPASVADAFPESAGSAQDEQEASEIV
jgi:hypothetical protein